MKRLRNYFQTARQMNLQWQVRAVLVRIWPLSMLVRLYYRVRFSQYVHGMLNRDARLTFQRHKTPLDAVQQSAVAALRHEGIYQTHVEELFADQMLFRKVRRDTETLISGCDIQKQISQRRSSDLPTKWYVVRALGLRPTSALPESVVELFLNRRLLDVVNEYLGLCCRLRYVDLWYNIPTKDSEPTITSERWHRDHEDIAMLKVFFYLNDVNEDMGPFTYVKETQRGGKYGDLFPARPPKGSCPPDSALERIVTAEQVRVCTGMAGTVLLADTTGIHRGGRAKSHPRILLVANYTTQTGLNPIRYKIDARQHETLSPVARYALGDGSGAVSVIDRVEPAAGRVE